MCSFVQFPAQEIQQRNIGDVTNAPGGRSW